VELYPVNSNLVVKPIEQDSTTSFGLVIPDTAKAKPQKGTVESSEPGSVYKPGMTILYSKYAGIEVRVDGADLLIVKERDVLAAVVEDAA
jgi:chaperonin GroES